MIIFKKLSWRNFLSTGDNAIEVILNKTPATLIVGSNGAGKCVCINTIVKVRNKQTGEVRQLTIGDLYAHAQQNNSRKD